jgi:murein DD-endopeptidase MepM/ murein hydrolase activator NlpD
MKRLIAIIGALTLLACSSASAATKHGKPPPTAKAAKVTNFKYGTRAMRSGMAGKDVIALQHYLTVISIPVAADGAFGPTTRHSVKAYEKFRTKPTDGVVQLGEAKKIKALAERLARPASGSFLFPVVGAHNFGGPANAFGAPRAGHIHQGQDVMAACGTPMRTASPGYVRANAFQAGGAGYYVVIRSSITLEDYMYAHLAAPSTAVKGATLAPGASIGVVGETGDATACHLHFEMWSVPGWYTGGAPYDPLPSLKLWDSYS